MDTSILDLISNVGFPIAVVVYMFYRDNQMSAKHDAESKGFIEAINNNTMALTKLVDRLGGENSES